MKNITKIYSIFWKLMIPVILISPHSCLQQTPAVSFHPIMDSGLISFSMSAAYAFSHSPTKEDTTTYSKFKNMVTIDGLAMYDTIIDKYLPKYTPRRKSATAALPNNN